MILPCECPSPAHCLEATGGEQGLSADELEVARLRRELDAALTDASNARLTVDDLRGQLDTAHATVAELSDVRERARYRLATIVDEAFGPQEALGLDALLSRLERMLHERARQHEAALRERDEARAALALLDEESKS
jgi:predicted  nucleic acid-binding Zn-ribbon protein